jgi:hypothetical protein
MSLSAPRRRGTRMDGMANPGERSINIVTDNKPKVLEGLSHKGTGAGTRRPRFLVMGRNATGGQSAPTPCVCACDGTWQPRMSPVRESEPQGEPTDVREGADGRSEGHSVMGWRGVTPTGNITPRASGLTSIWSCLTREFGQPPEERRQMTAVGTLTGALSHRLTVRRLQARMVKVVSQYVFDVAWPRSARGVRTA